MRGEFPVDISGLEVFPPQDISGHAEIGYVARIDFVGPTTAEHAGLRVGIQNRTGYLHGSSILELESDDARRFMDFYKIRNYRGLVGKPVISVYTRSMGQMLIGLIPINLDGN